LKILLRKEVKEVAMEREKDRIEKMVCLYYKVKGLIQKERQRT